MTAHAMKGDREHCLESGMDAYVSKPLRPETLFEAMEQLVAGVESVRSWFEAALGLLAAARLALATSDAVALEGAGRALAECITRRAPTGPAFEAAFQLEMIGRSGDLSHAEEACRRLDQELRSRFAGLESPGPASSA
jgi:hypothetical protein